jgi:DNA-binding response OmpR family regulator
MSSDARIDRRRAPPRVLVVEDDMMIAMLLEDMLADLGYETVGPCARLAEAVDKARQESLDAAILDVNLDGKPVWPVAEALAARGILFLFATGYGETALGEPWSDLPTLAKPFSRRDLERALARLVPSKIG